MSETFAVCSMCRKPIPMNSKFYRCSVGQVDVLFDLVLGRAFAQRSPSQRGGRGRDRAAE
jgi:hypothetical protein